VKVLIATDVFPPRCGGAGWSAYYLARALRARGHTVAIARPRFAAGAGRARTQRGEYDGLPVAELLLPLPANPVARLWARNVWAPRRLRRFLLAEATRLDADLIHAQHMLTVPAAVGAAVAWRARRGRRLPVVATVRDYWPLCYYSTMQAPRGAGRGPATAPPRDVPIADCGRAGAVWRALIVAQGLRAALAQAPLLPARQAAVVRRQAALRAADMTIAVSQFVARALLRGGAVRAERLCVIPNLVDLPQVDALLAAPAPLARFGLEPNQPFLLFVGKLDPSKGAGLLPVALAAAGVGAALPVLFAGSGALRPWLEAQGRARGLDFRFGDWLDNADTLRLMKRATVLLFPSAWDEPLTRVLLEACAVGATILALHTGGTADIIEDAVNGRLVGDMGAFAAGLRDLLDHPLARAQLAVGARATAERQFSADVVVAGVEEIYRSVVCE
jgi:glycogen synthase